MEPRCRGHIYIESTARDDVNGDGENRTAQRDQWKNTPVAYAEKPFRRPQQEAIYRARTKAKRFPDSNLVRFYRSNPNAPHKCESCGETRVLDVAHKPSYPRWGAWRSASNCVWLEMVWVLWPTCHALLDRMHYSPADLSLVE